MGAFARTPKVTTRLSAKPGAARAPAANAIHRLQREVGNRVLQRIILAGAKNAGDAPVAIQTKLAVNQPGDIYEQEADRVAEQVMQAADPMRAAAPSIQRMCAECEEEHTAFLQGVEDQDLDEQGLDEAEVSAGEAAVFRKAEVAARPQSAEAFTALEDRLDSRAGGEALAAPALQRMEEAFGRDFSRVRVHRDAEAGALSRQLGAQAFTYGSHVYFGDGKYDPDGSSGRRLLAHELTHVAQQGEAEPLGDEAAPSASRTADPTIQRTATWAASTAHPVNNLAVQLLTGQGVGWTLPTLNGNVAVQSAKARAALNKPAVFVEAVAGGFNASVATVPTNIVSCDVTTLEPGPWIAVATREMIGQKMAEVEEQCQGGDVSFFRAKGMPDDATFAAGIRTHEAYHVADAVAVFDKTIAPWDKKLTDAKAAGTSFNAPTHAEAVAALYAAMGGTPEQIADRFVSKYLAAGAAFHQTPEGAGTHATNPWAMDNCVRSSVDCM